MQPNQCSNIHFLKGCPTLITENVNQRSGSFGSVATAQRVQKQNLDAFTGRKDAENWIQIM